MSSMKIAISIDAMVLEEIRACTAASGTTVSGWLTDAARRKLRTAAAQAALDDYEAEFGKIPQEEIDAARKRWQD